MNQKLGPATEGTILETYRAGEPVVLIAEKIRADDEATRRLIRRTVRRHGVKPRTVEKPRLMSEARLRKVAPILSRAVEWVDWEAVLACPDSASLKYLLRLVGWRNLDAVKGDPAEASLDDGRTPDPRSVKDHPIPRGYTVRDKPDSVVGYMGFDTRYHRTSDTLGAQEMKASIVHLVERREAALDKRYSNIPKWETGLLCFTLTAYPPNVRFRYIRGGERTRSRFFLRRMIRS